MTFINTILITVAILSSTFAQADIAETAQQAADKAISILNETKVRRQDSNYFVLGSYSPMDLIIPSKYGITLGYIKDVDTTYEFEYLHASVAVPFLIEDLGKMSDDRYSIIRRSYFGGNSFNFSYGLTYFDFSVHLGDKFLNKISAGNYPSLDLISLQSLGFNVAVGNRWSFNRNITFGIDWISWAQPVFSLNRKSAYMDYATNQEDRDNVDKSMKFISYFPRLALLKLQLGILF